MKASRNFGKRIKDIRMALNMTQEEFANEIGVEKSHISRMECGRKGISLTRMKQICERFDVPMDYFSMSDEAYNAMREKMMKGIIIDISKMRTFHVGMVRRFIEGLKG